MSNHIYTKKIGGDSIVFSLRSRVGNCYDIWTEIMWTTLEPKDDPFSKQFSYEEWCFNLEGHLWHASLSEVDESWERKKKKQKEKLIVMSCHALEKFDWVQTKIKKAKFKKCDEKLQSFFSYKDSLFSLGNYVWDNKRPSFIILSLI